MPIERIHLKCGYDALLSSVAARLEASGYAVSKNSHPATESTISLSSDNGEELETIQASLGPLNTRIIWNPDIGDIVEINLGDGQLLSELNVTVNAGSMVLNAQLKRESNPWGFNEFSTSVKDVDEVSVVFGMCSEFNLGLIEYFLAEFDITMPPKEKRWDESDRDVWINLFVPDGFDPLPLINYSIVTDSPADASAFSDILEGFGLGTIEVIEHSFESDESDEFSGLGGLFGEPEWDLAPEFKITIPRDLSKGDGGDDIKEGCEKLLSESFGVELAHFPLTSHVVDEPEGRIVLPLKLFSDSEMIPYAGDNPARWTVSIQSDEVDVAEEAAKIFADSDYRTKTPTVVENECFPFIQYGYGDSSDAFTLAGDGVRGLMGDNEIFARHLPEMHTIFDGREGESASILVNLPMNHERTSSPTDIKEMACDYRLSVFADSEHDDAIEKVIKPYQFGQVACAMFAPGRGGEEDGWEERFHVEFGSAPFSLVKTVCEDIRAAYNIDDDVDISYQRLWDDSDIWVYVPWRFHANLGLQLPSSSAGLDDELDSWVAPSSEGIQRSFIEMMEEEE